ncbi:NACHT domain- and WD repeat-containing protein 1, partial [Rhizoclosmatium hyalinum]
MSGLKLGIRIGMGLATSEVPLVLIIDGLYDLTNEADALNIDWLPALLPENVKVIISANPVSKKQSLFLSLCSKFPSVTPQQQQDMISNISNAMYLELGPLSSREVDRYVTKLIAASKRTLTSEQMTLLTTKAQASRVPLYISTAFQLCASKWTGMTDYSVAKRALQSESVSGILEDALEQLEKQFGVLLVSRICAFITAARNGLSLGELTDVVSLEWDVVSEVFEGKDVVVRRLNSVLVEQVLWELQGCLAKKRVGAGGLEAYFWSSSLFKSVAAERYLYLTDRLVATHRSLANYWRDKKVKEAAGTSAPATETKSSNGRDKTTTVVKTFGFNQTLLILGKPNERRISSVVWHLLNCGTSGATEAVKTLQSISFLGAAIDAGLLDEILECFKFALENLGVSIYSAQLTE